MPCNDTMKTLTHIAEETHVDEDIGQTAQFDTIEMTSNENLNRNMDRDPNKQSIVTVYKSKENLSNGPKFDLGREMTFKKEPRISSPRGENNEVIDSRIKLLDEKINRYKQENQEIAQELNKEEEDEINEEEFKEIVGGEEGKVRINPMSKTDYVKSNPHYFSNTTIISKINKNAVSNPERGLKDVKVDMTEIEASRIIDQLEASNLAELSYNYEMEKQRMMEMIKTQKKIINEMEQKIVSNDNPASAYNADNGPYNFDQSSRPTFQTPLHQHSQGLMMRSIPLTPIPKMDLNNYSRGGNDPGVQMTHNGDSYMPGDMPSANNNFLANSDVNTSIKKQARPRSSNRSHRHTNPYTRARSNNISFSHMNNGQSHHTMIHESTPKANPLFQNLYRKKHEWSRIREKSLNTGWNTPNLANVPNLPLNPAEEYLNPVDKLIKSSRMNYAKKRTTFKKRKRKKTRRMKSRKSRVKASKSREKRMSRSRVAGKSVDALNYFVKGVRNLVESHSEYYNFEPTCRAKSIRKKRNAIKLICKTLKGEKLGKTLKKAVETKRGLKSERLCEKIKKKRKKKRTKKKKHFDVIAALNRLGGFDS